MGVVPSLESPSWDMWCSGKGCQGRWVSFGCVAALLGSAASSSYTAPPKLSLLLGVLVEAVRGTNVHVEMRWSAWSARLVSCNAFLLVLGLGQGEMHYRAVRHPTIQGERVGTNFPLNGTKVY
jgi:hypothetical protein